MRGRLHRVVNLNQFQEISIHAPMRGRPAHRPVGLANDFISIHAPMRGRLSPVTGSSPVNIFQSTPPCGGDIREIEVTKQTIISIHAPMRGRPSRDTGSGQGGQFQSTPPCGGDLEILAAGAVEQDFNPRPHAGATRIPHAFLHDSLFQSTPPCGGDDCRCHISKTAEISIHAPMRGRLQKGPIWPTSRYFNPRPHAGATLPICYQLLFEKFQSTPPCGGDVRVPW